jgi:N6-L-threonylcarbamoyladenine synthase
MLILGIESSCDETAIAIVEDGRKVISNEVFSQIPSHQEWGGVIPELASRMHLDLINDIFKRSLENAKLTINDISAIAVTQGPGLLGSLLVGINFAKALAWIYNKPLIPVNHLHGHICANFLGAEDLQPPFLCLLASGGHTQIIHVKSYDEYEILGETLDDAAGEAFDKVARLMNLKYPGGPEIDKLASKANDSYVSDDDPARFNSTAIKHGKYVFPIAQVADMDFSFSGLKTSVLRVKEKIGNELWEKDKAKIARAFQTSISKTFIKKIKDALDKLENEKTIVIAGGVAANTEIRKQFSKEFSAVNGYKLVIPSLKYCTDNAAMIASAGYFIRHKASRDLSFEGFSRV